MSRRTVKRETDGGGTSTSKVAGKQRAEDAAGVLAEEEKRRFRAVKCEKVVHGRVETERGESSRSQQHPSQEEDDTARRVLRLHYRGVMNLINDKRDDLLKADSLKFGSIITEVDELHQLVQKPREQVADAEALLDISSTLVCSVKSHFREGVTPSDFITGFIKEFDQPRRGFGTVEGDLVQINWKDIGLSVSSIFRKFNGCCNMLGPMDTQLKQRKIAVQRQRTRPTESSRPEELDDPRMEEKTHTDKNMCTMFDILRKKKCVRLEALVLNRKSFAQTVENLFALSFLVKDGRVKITLDQKGCHYTSPTNAPDSRDVLSGNVSYSHFVFRFDYKDWKMMTEMVPSGEELMPHRMCADNIPASQAEPVMCNPRASPSTTPIRKLLRNPGLVIQEDSVVEDSPKVDCITQGATFIRKCKPPSPAVNQSMQPSAALKRGPCPGPRTKKLKSSMPYPSSGLGGKPQGNNRGPSGTFPANEPTQPATYDPLIGKKVWTRSPDDDNFYEAVITDYNATEEKEGLITEPRNELRVSDEEHREVLSRVNADDMIRKIREWRKAGGLQPGMLSTSQQVHGHVDSPTVSAFCKKRKTSQSMAFMSMGAPSPAVNPPMQPSSAALKRGLLPDPRTKKAKSSMRYPSSGLSGRPQGNNRGPSRTFPANEPTQPATCNRLIGKKVRTRWPDDDYFYEAVITDYNAIDEKEGLITEPRNRVSDEEHRELLSTVNADDMIRKIREWRKAGGLQPGMLSPAQPVHDLVSPTVSASHKKPKTSQSMAPMSMGAPSPAVNPPMQPSSATLKCGPLPGPKTKKPKFSMQYPSSGLGGRPQGSNRGPSGTFPANEPTQPATYDRLIGKKGWTRWPDNDNFYETVITDYNATEEKEGLNTEPRKELRVSNEEHREVLSRVNADDMFRKIREWRKAGGLQPGMVSTSQTVHDLVDSPTISASRKKPKTSLSMASMSMGAPSPAVNPPMQPSSSALKRGPLPGPRTKKSKSSMQYPSSGLGGRPQGNNRGPSGTFPANGPTQPATYDPLIEKKVWTRWPADDNFYEAVIADYNATEEKEGLITEPRYELRVSNEEHREVLSRVNADDMIWKIREWRKAGGLQTGMLSTSQQVHGHVDSPTVSASCKKPKTSQSMASMSMGAPSPAVNPPMQPSSASLKRGPLPGPKTKKPKSSIPYPSSGLGGSSQGNNRGPSGTFPANEPPQPATYDRLIGKKVWTRSPDDDNFYEAVITDYNATEGRHAFIYDINTANETWEWINLEEISPEDIRWGGEDCGASRRGSRPGPGRGNKKPLTRGGHASEIGRGKGTQKSQAKKDNPQLQNGVGNKALGDIDLLHTATLMKEVEKVVSSNRSDPSEIDKAKRVLFEIDKAKRILNEHEQALVDAIARLEDASDGESDGRQHRP